MMATIATLMLLLGGVALQTGHWLPILFLLGATAFATHAIHRYLVEQLENESLPVPDASPASFLEAGLVRSLRGKKTITAGDLLTASVASKRGRFMLDEMGITTTEMLEACLHSVDESIDVGEFLEYAAKRLEDFGETRIDANIILFLLFSHVDSCTALLHKADLSEDDLLGLVRWEGFHSRFKVSESSWTPDAIRRNASLGRSWVMGYTSALDALTKEVNPIQRSHGEKSVVIHKEAIANVMRVFSRGKQRNIMLMGKVGVGKETLIDNIAIALRAQERAAHVPFTRVLVLQTEKLLSATANPDAFLLSALSRAQKSGHFVLVIKDFSLFLKSASENLKAVLMKCLDANGFGVIAVVDAQDYHSIVKTDAVMDSKFEKITVEDSTDEETMTVLMAHYFAVEGRKVRITYKAIKSIVDLCKRYLSTAGGFPGKAIDVMDDAILRAMEHGHAFVKEDHVRDVISLKSRVNVKKVGTDEKERLMNLETKLQTRIIGQDPAIKAVSAALKRARMDLGDRKRPIGTFLFLGPTGVGKTQTAKVLAEEYFGSADAIIRLDMNEYSQANAAFSIIGAQGGGGDGFLAQRVQDKPFSLILLDEIEKAHPSVLNMFLQILDEGFLTDSRGVRTDFRNTIIIATSNAGALFIRDFIREHKDFDKNRFKDALIETILHEKLFSPEFVNRFDEIVLYYPLSEEGAKHVAHLMLGEVVDEIKKRRGIDVVVEQDVVTGLVERGYSVEFGAREMRRTVTGMIEDYLADYFLTHDVPRGGTITIKNGDLKW